MMIQAILLAAGVEMSTKNLLKQLLNLEIIGKKYKNMLILGQALRQDHMHKNFLKKLKKMIL